MQQDRYLKLSELAVGESAVIASVAGEGALRQHFLDMGVIPGAEITVIKFAPMGDPIELRIHDYELTLRKADAEKIEVTKIGITEENSARQTRKPSEHPGLGEEGTRFHPKGSGEALPDGTVLTFALVGNQNSGKTTLFNQLTGANQHVGNFPGVTVERKDGQIRRHRDTSVVDLPGIYSMSPYSGEELVSRNYVLEGRPKAIINIVDATSLERGLYLTMQLLEMNIPMVVALNMMDEISANGGSIDVNAMERFLGTPVVPISAAKGEGIDELVSHAVHIARYQEKPVKQDYCGNDDHGGAVHRCLHGVSHLIEDHAARAGIPVRFAASKAIEGDSLIIDALGLDQNEKETLEHIVLQMENERGLDRSAAIADMRYAYAKKVYDGCVIKPAQDKARERSSKIDRVLTGKWTAIPVFIGIMALIFYLTFNVIGPVLQDLVAMGVERLTEIVDNAMTAVNVNEAVHGLVIDGIFEGVGSVLSFLPIIVVMFFFLSILEDSGYIARVAFFMDRLLRKLGLSGRSIVPMLIGFGCTVPAVMSTRTLPSERDRYMTILLTPFMSCTAKLPIYAFFVDNFFASHKALIMIGLYVLGIVFSILVALIYKKTLFRGEPVPFVMELPNYRLPGVRNVLQLLWDKAKDFLHRAFSVILIATIAVWFLKSFDFRFNMVADPHSSILAAAAGFIAPVFIPAGLADWRIVTSLICGFMAKESVVSIMEVLFTAGAGVTAMISPLTAASMLVFCLLYTPCVAAIASIRRELGGKWAVYVVAGQCVIAWIAAVIVRLIGMAFGLA